MDRNVDSTGIASALLVTSLGRVMRVLAVVEVCDREREERGRRKGERECVSVSEREREREE